jgi:hypothetical protein
MTMILAAVFAASIATTTLAAEACQPPRLVVLRPSAATALRPVTTDSIRGILGEPAAQHTKAGIVTWEFTSPQRPGYVLTVTFDARSHRMLRWVAP